MVRPQSGRCTGFPDLYYGQEDIPSSCTARWRCGGYWLEGEILALAWATVLRTITGVESPIFCLDGEQVVANPVTRSIQKAQLDKLGIEGTGYSAVFTDKVSVSQSLHLIRLLIWCEVH